ncbi:MAG TPA: histidine kinase [Ohtaekwangia sp.]|nr:histidine kinase [Ohtaekwangia sp.]
MSKQYKLAFWILLSLLIFFLFNRLFQIAVPEIALPFSIGTTIILISAFASGRILTLVWLRTLTSVKSVQAISILLAFIILGFIIIAFLLNAMIEKTTLFPFAATVLTIFLVAASVAAVVTIIRHQYKTKIQFAQAAMVQSRSELQLLQSQLSPHFLFNTLNNLYGLSLTKPEKVPVLLLKLSELLRYSVYDVKEVYVSIQDEVDYIMNYIAFEKIRLEPRLSINLDIESFPDACKIPPMLLVVFIENAFKHSRNVSEQNIFIEIGLHRKLDEINFTIKNSCSPIEQPSIRKDRHSGFGLESVRKRLDLLYQNRYTLRIEQTKTEHRVHLILPCQ